MTLLSAPAVRLVPLLLLAALTLSCGSSESKQAVQKPSKPAENLPVIAAHEQQPTTGTTPTEKPAPNAVAPKTTAPKQVAPNPGTPNQATPSQVTPNPATPNPATPNPATPNPATPNPATPNQAAPAIQFSAYDIDGKLRRADEWIGKQPVILNFWGTWCGPCRREIPELIRLYAEYKNKGIEIVSIAIRDTPTKVRRFTKQQGMNWVMLMDDRKVSRDFRITGVPTTFFINSKGEITNKFVGPRSYDVFKKAFEAIL